MAIGRLSPADVVATPSFTEERVRKDVGPLSDRFEVATHVGVIARPSPCVLFRPEEVHARSTERPSGSSAANGLAGVAHECVGFNENDFLAAHLDHHGVATVEARSLDSDGGLRYEPANCQRFKSSLAIPAVFVVDRDFVLGRLDVERWKRRQPICVRMHPPRRHRAQFVHQRSCPLG